MKEVHCQQPNSELLNAMAALDLIVALRAGPVNGLLAEGLLNAADIFGINGKDGEDPVRLLLSAAQASQLYLSLRTSRQVSAQINASRAALNGCHWTCT